MHRIVMLMMVLSPIAPEPNATDTSVALDPLVSKNPTPLVLFRDITKPPTLQPHSQPKADSPMLNYIFDSYATSNKHFHDKFRPPSFEGALSPKDLVIDADTGATITFDCSVMSLRDKMVSWLKVTKDGYMELLTIDLETHTADTRHRVDLSDDNWQLVLTDAKVQDSGIYCCQVSTHPPLVRQFKLTVHAPQIIMTKEAFLETSETLSLKCVVQYLDTGDTMPVIRWYHDSNTVPIEHQRGGVLIETDLLHLSSHLQVSNLKVQDAGHYTCALQAPLQMSALTKVHVLRGSSLGELQSGVKTTTSYMTLLLASILVILERYGIS